MDKVKVKNYAKNITSSFKFAAIDVAKEYAPNTTSFVNSNSELFKELMSKTRNKQVTHDRIASMLNNNKFIKQADEIKRNVIEDIKTGNFYNKERESKSDIMSFGNEDFNFDFNFDEDSDFTIADDKEGSSISNGDKLISNAIETYMKGNADQISSTLISTTDIIVKNNRAVNEASYLLNLQSYKQMNINLTNINNNITNMLGFTNKVLTTHIDNSSLYYEKSLGYQEETVNMIGELLEMERNRYNKELKMEKAASGNSTYSDNKFGNVTDFEGNLDLKGYTQMVKKNLDDQLSLFTMVGGMGMSAGLGVSPLQFVPQQIVKKLMGKELKNSVRRLDKTFSNMFAMAMSRLKSKGEESFFGPWSFMNDIFGASGSLKRNIRTDKYEQGAKQWNGVAEKALVEVIPGYLRQLIVLQGGEDKVYDYNRGKFISKSRLETEFKEIQGHELEASTRDIKKYFDQFGKLLNITTEENRKMYENDMQEFFEFFFKRGGNFDFNKDYEHYQSRGMKTNRKNYEIFRTMFKSMPRELQMSFDQNIIRGRERVNNEMQLIENKLDSVFLALFNNSETTKQGTIAKQIDNKGNTVFYYLSEILETLRTGRGVSNIQSPLAIQTPEGRVLPGNIKHDTKISGYNDYTGEIDYANFHDSRIGKALKEQIRNMPAPDSQMLVSKDEIEQRIRSILSKIDTGNKESIELAKIEYEELLMDTKGTRILDNSTIHNMKKIFKNYENTDDKSKLGREMMRQSTARTNLKDIKSGKFADRMMDTNFAGKTRIMIETVKNMATKPTDFIAGMLDTVDMRLYEVFYGVDNGKYNGKSVKGLFDVMTIKLEDTFSKLNDWMDEKLFKPFKEIGGFSGIYRKTMEAFGINPDDNMFINSVDSIFGSKKRGRTGFMTPILQQTKQDLKNMGRAGMSGAYDLTSTVMNRFGYDTTGIDKRKDRLFSDVQLGLFGKDYLSDQSYETIRDTNPIKENIKRLADKRNKIFDGQQNLFGDPEEQALAGFANKVGRRYLKPGAENAFKSDLLKNVPRYADGAEYITKPHVAVVGEGEAVLTKEQNKRRLKDKVTNIGQDIGNNFTSGMNQVKEALFGTKDDNQIGAKTNESMSKIMEDLKANYKEYVPAIGSSSIIGAGVALIPGIIGGPLLGAAVGAGVGLLRKSEAVQELLFGKFDENGEREGGVLFGKETMKVIDQYFPSMSKLGIAGMLSSVVLPGGPVAGLIIGSALGFAKENEDVKNYLFGEEGLLGKDMDKKVKKALPPALIGSAAMLLTGPFGIVGNAMIGGGLGILSTTDKFKEFMFGPEGEDGKREGGLLGSIKNFVVEPLKEFGSTVGEKLKNFVDENIKKPFQEATQPIFEEFKHIGKEMFSSVADGINKMFERTVGQPLNELIEDKIIKPFTNIFGKIFGTIAKMAGNVVASPFKFMSSVATSFKIRQMKEGRDGWMTDEQRKDVIAKNPTKFLVSKYGLNALASMLGLDKETVQNAGREKANGQGIGGRINNIFGKITDFKDDINANAMSKITTLKTNWREGRQAAKSKMTEAVLRKLNLARLSDEVKEEQATARESETGEGESSTSSYSSKRKASFAKKIQDEKKSLQRKVDYLNKRLSEKENDENNEKRGKRIGGKNAMMIGDNIKGIYDEVHGQLDGVGYNINTIANILIEQFGAPKNAAIGKATKRGNKKRGNFLTRFFESLKSPGRALKAGIRNLFWGKEGDGGILGTPMKVIHGLTDKIVGVGKAILDVPKAILGGIKNIGSVLFEGVKMIGPVIGQTLVTSAQLITAPIKALVPVLVGVGEGIGHATSAIIGGVGEIVGSLIGGLKFIPDLVSGIADLTMSLGSFLWGGVKGTVKAGVKGLIGAGGIVGGLGSLLFGKKNKAGAPTETKIYIDGGTLDLVRRVEVIGSPKDNLNTSINNLTQSVRKANQSKIITPTGVVRFDTDSTGAEVPIQDKVYKDYMDSVEDDNLIKQAQINTILGRNRKKYSKTNGGKDGNGSGNSNGLLSALMGVAAPAAVLFALPKLWDFFNNDDDPTRQTKDGQFVVNEDANETLISTGIKMGAKIVNNIDNFVRSLKKSTTEMIEKVNTKGKQVISKLTGKGSSEISEEFAEKVGKESIQKINHEASQKLTKETSELIGKEVSEKVGKETVQVIGKESAQKVTREIAEVAVRGAGDKVAIQTTEIVAKSSKSNIDNFVKLGKQIMNSALDYLKKKESKLMKTVKTSALQGLFDKLLHPKMLLKYTKEISEGLIKMATAAATVLASDVFWAATGFVRGLFTKNAAKLFYVSEKDVDGKMRLISACIEAVLEISFAFVIDILNLISTELFQFDFIHKFAVILYDILSSSEKSEQLRNKMTEQEQKRVNYNDTYGTELSPSAFNDMRGNKYKTNNKPQPENIPTYAASYSYYNQGYKSTSNIPTSGARSQGNVRTSSSKPTTSFNQQTVNLRSTNPLSPLGRGKYGAGVHFSQRDPRWGGMQYDSSANNSMAEYGCAPTVAAMVAKNYVGNNDINPVQAANYSQTNGFKVSNDGTKHQFFDSYLGNYGIDTETKTNKNSIVQDLKAGKQVVLLGQGGSNSPYGDGPHYVLANGMDKNGNVNINDPYELAGSQKYRLQDVIQSTKMGISTDYGKGRYKKRLSYGGAKIKFTDGYNMLQDTMKVFNNIISKILGIPESAINNSGDGISINSSALGDYTTGNISVINFEYNDADVVKKINGFYSARTKSSPKLKTSGQAFLNLSKKWGVDPYLVASIVALETGWGTSSVFARHNNPSGTMDPRTGHSTPMHFNSVQDGLEFTFKNLKENYLDKGLVTIAQIGAKYCPIGAANDPNGTNKNWVPTVSKFYKEMSGRGELNLGVSTASNGLYRMINNAKAKIGKPYIWGAEGPVDWDGDGDTRNGWDCSGLVLASMHEAGFKDIKRTTADMSYKKYVDLIDPSNMIPGDLMFRKDGNTMGHIGIYAGNGEVVHAANSNRGVVLDKFKGPDRNWTHFGRIKSQFLPKDTRPTTIGSSSTGTVGNQVSMMAKGKGKSGTKADMINKLAIKAQAQKKQGLAESAQNGLGKGSQPKTYSAPKQQGLAQTVSRHKYGTSPFTQTPTNTLSRPTMTATSNANDLVKNIITLLIQVVDNTAKLNEVVGLLAKLNISITEKDAKTVKTGGNESNQIIQQLKKQVSSVDTNNTAKTIDDVRRLLVD